MTFTFDCAWAFSWFDIVFLLLPFFLSSFSLFNVYLFLCLMDDDDDTIIERNEKEERGKRKKCGWVDVWVDLSVDVCVRVCVLSEKEKKRKKKKDLFTT